MKLLQSLLIVTWMPLSAVVFADAPATMRVDYFHTGTALGETFSLDRVVIEPLPWPGNPDGRIDELGRGNYFYEVVEPVSGEVHDSGGFGSIFDEWSTTSEARTRHRTFHESVRFPVPESPVRLRILRRDERDEFSLKWSVEIDPADMLVQRAVPPAPAALLSLQESGPPEEKVDLLLLGDGYTAAQTDKFRADAERMIEALFAVEPFRRRRADFNVWGLMPPSPQEGVARPSSGQHRWTPLGTRYDAFRSERYVLTFENAALRDIAQHAPYEFIEILVNNETYGGGGIYQLYGTAAAGSESAPYLFVHEFGHHFAALADEYYTSPVAYEESADRPEPWEPNVTALTDPARLKWRHLVDTATPIPTPWPKDRYEKWMRDYQERRAQLRADNRPEAEMNALFAEQREFLGKLFGAVPDPDRVGAFEGAHYQANGYYRPQLDCLMFSRSERFCRVCSDAIEQVIDRYAR